MKHTASIIAMTAALLAGCANSQYAGTWSSAPSASVGDFRLGGMTLSTDGTYTAFADYGGQTRGFSGTWEIDSTGERDALVFQSPRPGGDPVRYWVERDANDASVLIVTDPRSGTVSRLVEVAGR